METLESHIDILGGVQRFFVAFSLACILYVCEIVDRYFI